MQGSNELIAFLKKVTILKDFKNAEFTQFSKFLSKIMYKNNTVLFKQGDKGTELYIVHKGSVAMSINTVSGDEKELARFGTGDFFGEMSIIDNAPRSATCRVRAGTELLRMKKDAFFRIMKTFPKIAIKVMYKMLNTTANRLNTTSRFIAEMVRWGNDASKRAITDEITGAYNRRYLDHAIKDCFISSRASRKSFSLVMAMVLFR